MPPEQPPDADLQACRALLSIGSKSFSLAARLLPRRVRDPATVLYAFCRVADDRIDNDPSASEATVDDLRERLRRAYAGRPDDLPVDRALAQVVERERVPLGLLSALLEGLGWDASGRRYETLEELCGYAARVAGSVGVMMSILMGARDEPLLARACDLGVAMQLTNIARDVGDDALRGRVYLPLSWLHEAGAHLPPGAGVPEPSHALVGVVGRLLREADVLYRRADAGIAALPPDCRVAIRSARLIYDDIGHRVAGAGRRAIGTRAVVPTWRKLWLLVRSLRPPPAEPSALLSEPLASARFLLTCCAEAHE